MFGLPYDIVAFLIVGVIAAFFLGRENVIVKLVAAVAFVCGIAPLGVTMLMTLAPGGSLLITIVVWAFVLGVLAVLAWHMAKPSDYPSSNDRASAA